MNYAIDLRRVEALRAYDRNSRTHGDEQLRRLVGAIHEFGWSRPVVVRGDTIAAGHGAVLAAEWIYRAGDLIYPVPGRDAGAAPFPRGMVPVLDATGWSDEQLRAYVLADNKLALLAGWDMELLAGELLDLRELGFDMELTGFNDAEIDVILTGDVSGAQPMPPPDGDLQEFRIMVVSDSEAEIEELKRLLGMNPHKHKIEAHLVIGMVRGYG